MNIHIVDGNNKLGKTPNISTLPGVDCGPGMPCAKDCYAQKFLFRPSVNAAWSENSELQRKNPGEYFTQIAAWFMRHKPVPWFRVHVAGDFINQNTLDNWFGIADCVPETGFLAFTKRFDLDFRARPKNFTIRASMWPGWGNPSRLRRGGLSIAWTQDGTETRIPDRHVECPGSCVSCRACWASPLDVVIRKHR